MFRDVDFGKKTLQKFAKKNKIILKIIRCKSVTYFTYKYMKASNSAKMYFLPKIHKNQVEQLL